MLPKLFVARRAGSSAPEVDTALPLAETFTGLCIQSGKELRCDDAETDTRVDKAAARALGIRSMVAVPIKEEGRVVGVLAVFASTAHAFGHTHMLVLKTMADQIAHYLHSTLCNAASSPEPFPGPPAKTIAVSAAGSPAPPPGAVMKRAEPPFTQRQLPVVPKVESARTTTLAEEIDPARFSQKKETDSHDELKESKTDFRRMFGTIFQRAFRALDAAAARKNRLGVDREKGNFYRMFEEVTVAQTRLSPDNAAAEIDRLILTAWRRKLPVYMELPSDISYLEIDVPDLALKLEMAPSEQKSLKACSEMILKRLNAAKAPAFLLDMDAIRFGVSAQIMELAERFRIQVATLNCAKGAVPESSPRCPHAISRRSVPIEA